MNKKAGGCQAKLVTESESESQKTVASWKAKNEQEQQVKISLWGSPGLVSAAFERLDGPQLAAIWDEACQAWPRLGCRQRLDGGGQG